MAGIGAVRVAEGWSTGNYVGLVLLILLVALLIWAVVRARN
jgi:flagellar biogenesis protein FliO